MNYTYAYKTSDGVRHEAAMDAESREAVFETLRARGIKAIKVVAADGSKANGEKEEARRKRKAARHYAFAAALAVLVSLASLVSLKSLLSKGDRPPGPVTATPRHQIYGDPAIVGGFEHGDFGDALLRQGDRLLAWFSQPGRITCPRNTSRTELLRLGDANVAALKSVVDSDVEIAAADSREVRELKQIVAGMHGELREYLANGVGTYESFVKRMEERQVRENLIYLQTKKELTDETDPDVFDKRNAALRRMGLQTVSMPE